MVYWVYGFIFPFLFPLGTVTLISRQPRATQLILALNMIVWLGLLLGPTGWQYTLALHPHAGLGHYFTYGFAHIGNIVGFLQLALNMCFFYVFGLALEQRVGPWRLGLFYILSVAGGGLVHLLFHPNPAGFLMGASAGVYGIIGAFIILHPFAEVRCFFPIKFGMIQIYGIFFLVIMGLIELLVYFAGLLFSLGQNSIIALAADLGGLGTGAGLAAAFYGFYAFSLKAEEDRQAEVRLQRKLGTQLGSTKPHEHTHQAGSVVPSYRQIEPADARLLPLHRAVMMGDIQVVQTILRDLRKKDISFSLMPGPQMDLARLLINQQAIDDAIFVLENLLASYTNEPIAAVARFELGRQLCVARRDPARAARLLREFIASGPAPALEREAAALLKNVEYLLSSGTPDRGSTSGSVKESTPPTSSAERTGTTGLFQMQHLALNKLPEASSPKHDSTGGLMARADALFGSPEDTNANQPQGQEMKEQGPFRPVAQSHEDSNILVRLDDSKVVIQPASGAAPTVIKSSADIAPQIIKDAPGFTPQERQVFQADTDVPPGLSRKAYPSVENVSSTPSAVPELTLPGLSDSVNMAPTGLPEVVSNWCDAGHEEADNQYGRETLEYGASTGWGDQTASPAQGDRAELQARFQFRPKGRYSVILTPECPIELPIVIGVLAPILGLPPEATHHAILRRRGMLAEGLGATAAKEMAELLAQHGQGATICDEGALPDFPPPEDVVEIEDLGESFRVLTTEGHHERLWRNLWLSGAGSVILEPGAPARVVVDLFLGRSPSRFRIWENLYRFPERRDQTIAAQFHAKILQLDNCFGAAVRTRTLSHWLRDADPGPPHRFNSLIEYENFLRWHLLAFFTPQLGCLP